MIDEFRQKVNSTIMFDYNVLKYVRVKFKFANVKHQCNGNEFFVLKDGRRAYLRFYDNGSPVPVYNAIEPYPRAYTPK